MAGTVRIAAPRSASNAPAERDAFSQVVNFLGGRQVFKKAIASKLDVHEAILKGIPGGALIFMVKQYDQEACGCGYPPSI